MEASCVRLLIAAAIGGVFAALRGRIRPWCTLYFKTGMWRRLVPASFIGTALGIWLSLVAYQYAEVAVASTLTSLTPIFIMPLVWIFLRQRVSLRAVVGAFVALAGAAALFELDKVLF